MSKTIEIPYTPRPLWRTVIHPALDKYRYAVLVCHRRFGKTVGVINHMIKNAISNNGHAPRYVYLAPYRNQAKMIAWSYLKYYTSVIEGLKKPNESELYVELPTKHKGLDGARIYVVGADNPDALRGTYWDGAILDEYAQIKSELYGEVLVPALADHQGFAWFIGTPKGQNQFYEKYLEAQKNPKWFSCLYRADETDVIPQTDLETMIEQMTDIEARQELYCDFTASAFNVLITIDSVTKACQRIRPNTSTEPLIMGVDVARFGDDRTTIWRRQGFTAYEPIILTKLDNMEVASHIANQIDVHHPKSVFVDVGAVGSGVVDRLHQLGYDMVQEISFGSKAADSKRYANKRSEMWYNIKRWLDDGGCLPNMPDLKTELTSIEYKFDNTGRIALEPKEKVKEKLGKSPDLADGLALTFAQKIIGVSEDIQYSDQMFTNIYQSEGFYNPLKSMNRGYRQ